jgi:hypothetical protein
MKKSAKPNDWKKLIDSQTKAISYQDFQEKSLERFSKNFYRSEIHSQLIEKNEQNYQKTLDKQIEGHKMSETLKSQNFEDLRRLHLKLKQQSTIFNDYIQQINSKLEKDESDLSKNLELERSIVKFHKLAEDSAKVLKSLKKSERISSFQAFIAEKSLEKIAKVEELNLNKEKDQQLVNESIEKFNKHQVEYRKKIKDVEKKQAENQKAYLQVIRSESQKFRSKTELVEKWLDEKKHESEAKEVIYLQEKLRMKKNQGKVLRFQMQEKSERKKEEVIRKTQDKEYSDLTVLKEKFLKNQEKVNENQFKSYYNKVLRHQICEKEFDKYHENTFNQREKMINKEIIENFHNDEENQFRGVPGLHRSQSALKSSLLRNSIKGQMFFSPQKKVQSPVKEASSRRGRSCDQSFVNDIDNRHDPILNPIGSKKILNASFQRGKGIASLFN